MPCLCLLALLGCALSAAESSFVPATLALDAAGCASAEPDVTLGSDTRGPQGLFVVVQGGTAGRYRMTIARSGEDPPAVPVAIPLYNAAVGNAQADAEHVAFDCYLQDDPAALLILAPATPFRLARLRLAPLKDGDPALPAPGASPLDKAPDPGALPALLRSMAPGPETAASLRAYTMLSPEDDDAVLDVALARIFPDGKRPDAPAAVAAAILAYCAQVIELKATGVQSGSAVLQQGFAFCHGMALAYAALCRRAGLPARVNALYNFGLMQSHNMVEVHYDDTWHLYDPTYGTLFQQAPLKDTPLASVSLQALMAHAVPAVQVVQVDHPIGSGAYVAAPTWRALPPDAHYARWPFSLQTFYDTLFARATPVVWSASSPAIFPVDLDVRESDTAWAGTVDGSLEDQFGKQPDRSYQRFAGAPVLGAMPVGVGLHLLRMRSSAAGDFHITMHVLPGATLRGLQLEALAGARVNAARQEGARLMVECSLDAPAAWLLLAPGDGAAMVDAYAVTRVPPATPVE